MAIFSLWLSLVTASSKSKLPTTTTSSALESNVLNLLYIVKVFFHCEKNRYMW